MYDKLEEKVKAEMLWLILKMYFTKYKEYNFDIQITDNGKCPCFYNDEAKIGITNSLDSNTPTLFIEVLQVADKGKGLGSEILYDICGIIDIIGFNLNLWTKKESKTERWYKKFGFKPTMKNAKGEIQLTRTSDANMNKYYIDRKISNEHKIHIMKFIREVVRNKQLIMDKAISNINKSLKM